MKEIPLTAVFTTHANGYLVFDLSHLKYSLLKSKSWQLRTTLLRITLWLWIACDRDSVLNSWDVLVLTPQYKNLCTKITIIPIITKINRISRFARITTFTRISQTHIFIMGAKKQNTITDGGVASPPHLLTIEMMFSNFKNLISSRNFKDSWEG